MGPLALLTLLLTGMDHWTTYLCLRAPIEGWSVVESNPVAGWLFTQAGLVPGLWIDTALTAAGVLYLMRTRVFSSRAKQVSLGLIAAATSYAVWNNLHAMALVGLSPLGAS
jgi:hypothetical protein